METIAEQTDLEADETSNQTLPSATTTSAAHTDRTSNANVANQCLQACRRARQCGGELLQEIIAYIAMPFLLLVKYTSLICCTNDFKYGHDVDSQARQMQRLQRAPKHVRARRRCEADCEDYLDHCICGCCGIYRWWCTLLWCSCDSEDDMALNAPPCAIGLRKLLQHVAIISTIVSVFALLYIGISWSVVFIYSQC